MKTLTKYLILLLWLGVVQTLQARVTIELKPISTINGKYIRLGDISSIESADVHVKQRLEDMIIGFTPYAGNNSIFHKEKVVSTVYAKVPDLRNSIIWLGGSQIKVIGGGNAYPAHEYVELAEKSLQRELEKKHKDIKITQVRFRGYFISTFAL